MHAPTSNKGVHTPSSSELLKSSSARRQFAVFALNMSWQLAAVVLVPVLGGVRLDKALGTSYACTIVGLVVALAGSGVVLWRTMQSANRLPVPKLTAAQKRDIQKSYEAEDDE